MKIKLNDRWLLYLLLSFMPFAAAWAFYAFYAQAPLSATIPYGHYDPYDYLMQFNAFAAHGFGMGHFSQNEVVPFVPGSPFGCHGPVYPAIIGIIGNLFGGVPYTAAPLYNFTVLTICILVLFHFTRPDPWKTTYIIALIISYPEFFHYTSTFWQESINLGSALVLAALFCKILKNADNKKHTRSLFFFLVLFSLIRPSWALLFPAYFIITAMKQKFRVFRGFALGFGCLFATFFVYQFYASPSVGHYAPWQLILMDLSNKSVGIVSTINNMFLLLENNIVRIYDTVRNDNFLTLVFLFAPTSSAYALYKNITSNSTEEKTFYANILWVMACNLLILFFTSFTAFLQPRHIYPSFLMCIIILSYFNKMFLMRMTLLGAQIAAMLYTFQLSQNYAYDVTHDIPVREAKIKWFADYTRRIIPFIPSENAWCNTLLVDDFVTSTEFLGVTPGIGISYILAPKLYSYNAKSRYIITKSDHTRELFMAKNRLRYISGTTLGDFYVNLDCDCPGAFQPMTSDLDTTRRLERSALSLSVPEHDGLHYADIRKSGLVATTTSTAIQISSNSTLLRVSAVLNIEDFFKAQTGPNRITPEVARSFAAQFRALMIELLFVEEENIISLVSKSIRAECHSGRNSNFILTDDDIASLIDNKPISSILWTHSESQEFICHIP